MRQGKEWIFTHVTAELPEYPLYPCDIRSSLETHCTNQINTPLPSTFDEYLQSQPQSQQQLTAQVELHQDPFTIAHHLSDTTCTLVSDGSSVPLRSAFGWTLGHPTHGILAEGSGPASGESNSYRAEAYGMHAALLTIGLILRFTQSTVNELDIWCDNQSLINRMKARQGFSIPFPNYSTIAEWDQLESIQSHIQLLDCKTNFQHVRGHQDEQNDRLTFEEQLNVNSGLLAGQQINWDVTARIRVSPDHVSKCHLHIHGRTITSNYKTNLRDAATAPTLRQRLLSHCQISKSHESFIDWNVFSTCNAKQKHLRVWKTKFLFNLLPTITTEQSYTHNRPECSFCPQKTDTWLHILLCPEPTRRLAFTTFLQDLDKTMTNNHTDPFLQQSIIHGLRTLIGQTEALQAPDDAIYEAQAQLGWINFLKGLWTLDWAVHQQQYLKDHQSAEAHASGTRWACTIIDFVLNAMHKIWIEYTQRHYKPKAGKSATHIRLTSRIRRLQQSYIKACPHHSHQFFIPEPEFDTRSVSQLRHWLTLHKKVVLSASKLQLQAEKLKQHLLTHFYSSH